MSKKDPHSGLFTQSGRRPGFCLFLASSSPPSSHRTKTVLRPVLLTSPSSSSSHPEALCPPPHPRRRRSLGHRVVSSQMRSRAAHTCRNALCGMVVSKSSFDSVEQSGYLWYNASIVRMKMVTKLKRNLYLPTPGRYGLL